MPIFIDQGDVLIKMKDKGIAVGLNKENATSEEIYNALHEVLHNSKYRTNIKRLSVLMRDVKETPLERVTQFLEYLMRHNGAEHLKLSSRHLNSFQYFSIDTILFLVSLLIIFIYTQFLVIKYLLKKYLWTHIKDWSQFCEKLIPYSGKEKLMSLSAQDEDSRNIESSSSSSSVLNFVKPQIPRFVDNISDLDNGRLTELHERKRQ